MNSKWIGVSLCCAGLMTLGFIYKKAYYVQSDTLVVGIESGFPPYEMLDSNGSIIGFDADVIKAVAHNMGKQAEFKILSFDNLIVALQQKKVDVIISAISITESRKAVVNLVPYHTDYGKGTFPLVFWKNIPKNIKKIEDLDALQPLISVQTGSVQSDVIASYPFVTIRQLGTIPELIMDIKYGKADACMLEPVVLESIKKSHPEIVSLEVPLPQSFKNEGHGIGIRKQDEQLTKEVTKAIEALQKDGTLAALEKKWLCPSSPCL